MWVGNNRRQVALGMRLKRFEYAKPASAACHAEVDEFQLPSQRRRHQLMSHTAGLHCHAHLHTTQALAPSIESAVDHGTVLRDPGSINKMVSRHKSLEWKSVHACCQDDKPEQL